MVIKNKRRWITLVVMVPLTALSLRYGIATHCNSERIKRHRNPGTEFNLFDRSQGIPYTERTTTGLLTKNDDTYCLQVLDLLYNDKILELTFPVKPKSRNSSDMKAAIVRESNANNANAIIVPVEIVSGKYDDSNPIDNKITFSDGAPSRFTIGVYWDLFTRSCNDVEYTLGYKYDETNRFTTVHCESVLPWNKRSYLRMAALYACYLVTIPCDIVTSPLQAFLHWIAPEW